MATSDRPLEGELVVVEPLASTREDSLFAAGQDLDVWRYLTAFPNACENRARFHRWMQEALVATEESTEGGWAIIERCSGAPIGSTPIPGPAARAPRARDRLDLDR